MRTRLAISLAIAAIAIMTTPASGGGDTCFGQEATHVFGPQQEGNGTSGDDVIISEAFMTNGLGGDDRICGRGTDPQEFTGGGDHDRIHGKAGDDSIAGNRGNDRIYGGVGEDSADGGKGTDRCWTEHLRRCEFSNPG